jgi:pilus assembly protein CpaD
MTLIVALGAALSACATTNGGDNPMAGLPSTHVPVVNRVDYVFDAQAPGGSIQPSELARLDAWFRTMDMRYGDNVYVGNSAGADARGQVQSVVGQYGILLSNGAPVTVGATGYDTVRVVVSRTQASVPGCPDWSAPSNPNFNNRQMSNFGCGVNAALAAQVANPQDLVMGHAGEAASDGATASKAISMYRSWEQTGVTEGRARRTLDSTSTTKEQGN